MGNTQVGQTVDVKRVLTRSNTMPISSKKRLTVQKTDTSGYSTIIPLPGLDDVDVVKNITIPDKNFRNVILFIGSEIIPGEYVSERWEFNKTFPLFDIDRKKCYIKIYTIDSYIDEIDVEYDECVTISNSHKDMCRESGMFSDNLIYTGGQVY